MDREQTVQFLRQHVKTEMLMKTIAIIRIPFSDPDLENLTADWTQLLQSGMLNQGSYTRRLEWLFRQFTGAGYAVATNTLGSPLCRL